MKSSPSSINLGYIDPTSSELTPIQKKALITLLTQLEHTSLGLAETDYPRGIEQAVGLKDETGKQIRYTFYLTHTLLTVQRKNALAKPEGGKYKFAVLDDNIVLGEGAFGAVIRGAGVLDITPGRNDIVFDKKGKFAIKRMNVTDFAQVSDIKKEVEISGNVDYLRAHEAVFSNREAYILMRRVKGKELFDALQKEKFSEGEKFRIIGETIKALRTLQALGLVHKDLKPENMIFRIKKNGEMELRIIDHGLSEKIGTKGYTPGGTPGYIPPEMLSRKEEGPLNPRVDVYATAFIIAEIINPRFFKELEKIGYPDQPRSTSPDEFDTYLKDKHKILDTYFKEKRESFFKEMPHLDEATKDEIIAMIKDSFEPQAARRLTPEQVEKTWEKIEKAQALRVVHAQMAAGHTKQELVDVNSKLEKLSQETKGKLSTVEEHLFQLSDLSSSGKRRGTLLYEVSLLEQGLNNSKLSANEKEKLISDFKEKMPELIERTRIAKIIKRGKPSTIGSLLNDYLNVAEAQISEEKYKANLTKNLETSSRVAGFVSQRPEAAPKIPPMPARAAPTPPANVPAFNASNAVQQKKPDSFLDRHFNAMAPQNNKPHVSPAFPDQKSKEESAKEAPPVFVPGKPKR